MVAAYPSETARQLTILAKRIPKITTIAMRKSVWVRIDTRYLAVIVAVRSAYITPNRGSSSEQKWKGVHRSRSAQLIGHGQLTFL